MPLTHPRASSSWPSDLYFLKEEHFLHFKILLLFLNLVTMIISTEFSLSMEWVTLCFSECIVAERNLAKLVQVEMIGHGHFIDLGTGKTIMSGPRGRRNWSMSLDLNSLGRLSSYGVDTLHSNSLSSLCLGSLLYVLSFGLCHQPISCFTAPNPSSLEVNLLAWLTFSLYFPGQWPTYGWSFFALSIYFWCNQMQLDWGTLRWEESMEEESLLLDYQRLWLVTGSVGGVWVYLLRQGSYICSQGPLWNRLMWCIG